MKPLTKVACQLLAMPSPGCLYHTMSYRLMNSVSEDCPLAAIPIFLPSCAAWLVTTPTVPNTSLNLPPSRLR